MRRKNFASKHTQKAGARGRKRKGEGEGRKGEVDRHCSQSVEELAHIIQNILQHAFNKLLFRFHLFSLLFLFFFRQRKQIVELDGCKSRQICSSYLRLWVSVCGCVHMCVCGCLLMCAQEVVINLWWFALNSSQLHSQLESTAACIPCTQPAELEGYIHVRRDSIYEVYMTYINLWYVVFYWTYNIY